MASSSTDDPRLAQFRETISQAACTAVWFDGIPGLYLDINELSELGADSQFLEWWECGRPLGGTAFQPGIFHNYPSMVDYEDWAERRMEPLRKPGKDPVLPIRQCTP